MVCAGVIVIYGNETIIVKSKRGYSFPKGSLELGENYFTAATRELKEETGLDHTDLLFIKNYHLDERSPRGHHAVRYFVALAPRRHDNFVWDEEIEVTDWMNYKDIMKLIKMKPARKEILRKIFEYLGKDCI